MYSAIIIGYGKSGKRFHEVIDYINKEEKKIDLLCIVEKKTKSINVNPIEVYGSCIEAFKKFPQIDLIFICSNEKDHFNNLVEIKKQRIKFKRIICEKPLTESLTESIWVQENFSNQDITLNFLERYSPICEEFIKQRNSNKLKPFKVLFFWGKNRINDLRPTMGTFSEISHPLDLVSYLCGSRHDSFTKVNEILKTDSYFNPLQGKTVDTLSLNYQLSNLTVTGHSSFIWDERKRKILIYCKDINNKLYLYTLEFDKPSWDDDLLIKYEINEQGTKKTLEYKSKRSSYDKEIEGLNKLYKFILYNIDNIENEVDDNHLAYIDQGLYIQGVLEQLKKKELGEMA